MQVKGLAVGLSFVILAMIGWHCNSITHSTVNAAKEKHVAGDVPEYEILLGANCLMNEKCVLYLWVDKDDINETGVLAIIGDLKSRYPNRKSLRIAFLADKKTAAEYLRGNREWREVDKDTSAIYIFDSRSRETLKIRAPSTRTWKNIVLPDK